MRKKKIGLLFGMEDTFPWALIKQINERGGDRVEAAAVEIAFVKDDGVFDYDLILDRISHEVPFYRTYLKCAAASGVQVVNNPFWWSADDKFFDNLAAKAANVAVPRTVLLPHKHYPPNTETKSFRNLRWVNWDEVFNYLGWPIFMKPAYGGGWKDVYKVHDREEFFAAYDQTRDLTMMAQEAIEFTEYYRCYVLGRNRVHIMQYDPKQPHRLRYVQDPAPMAPPFEERIRRDAMALCAVLGYDMNTVEFAVRDGIPYAIDFMNCAPDADRVSVGDANFEWVVSNMAEVLIDIVTSGRKLELTGSWPTVMQTDKPIDEEITDTKRA
ncbi:MAG: glutathione synthase/ribosomal protein modification glutaminyl transferase-like protein [Acidobacteria bacterium]|nr:glutathione synthase/ribosomal protein modification glutaminyl transferase-like protein [Acidobacteriota bacterium]